MTPERWRSTGRAAAGGALLFGLLGLYLNTAIGAPFLSNPGPVAMLAVIGGTVGGLVAPLFGSSSGGGGDGAPDGEAGGSQPTADPEETGRG